jgi:hypothetical protein
LAHEDGFPGAAALEKGYNRRATLLVYLNDVPQVSTSAGHVLTAARPASTRHQHVVCQACALVAIMVYQACMCVDEPPRLYARQLGPDADHVPAVVSSVRSQRCIQRLKLFVRRCEECWMHRCGAMHAT